jgi:hypothetical protein
MKFVSKSELFWIILIAVGTYFVLDAAIENKVVSLPVGLIFWYLGGKACQISQEMKDRDCNKEE